MSGMDPDEMWRASPTAPCGCEWDGWHCPHCASVTEHSGDAWEPAHTVGCHNRAKAAARAIEAALAGGPLPPVDDDF